MLGSINVVSWPYSKIREKARNQNNKNLRSRTSSNGLEKGVPKGTFLELTQRAQLTWKRNEPGPRPLWAVGKKCPLSQALPTAQKWSNQQLDPIRCPNPERGI